MPASGGFHHSPGQQDITFQPVEHLHQHRQEHHTPTVFAAGLLKRIRQAAALRFASAPVAVSTLMSGVKLPG